MASNNHPEQIDYESATISSGQTTSAAKQIFGTTLCGIIIPSSFTGTSLKFQASADGTNFFNMYKDGADFSVSVAASKFIILQPADFAGVNYLKLISSATEAANRTLTLALRTI